MPIEILMPALSPTMTEGTLAKWCKNEGDKVKSGDVIAEIETDKATMEVETPEDGVLGKILVSDGTKGVKINSAIALLLIDGEDASALKNIETKTTSEKKSCKNDPCKKKSCGVSEEKKTPCSSSGYIVDESLLQTTCDDSESQKIFASPLAKRIADQNNIGIHFIRGSGPKGRIVKSDVLDAINSGSGNIQQQSKIIRRPPSQISITGLRQAIAKKLSEVKRNIPHFYLSIDIDVEKLLEMRADINKDNDKALKISVNDLIVKATSLAFKDIPEANASWQNTHIDQYHNVDAAIAVSVEGGIFTPIVKDADKKSIFDISKEVKELAARAKSGQLKSEEFLGGSFTISNLGMYDVDSFTAILNPPQSCIFAIGKAKKMPIVENDKIIIRSIVNITVSCDHRVVDGAVCATILNKVKYYLENPFKLLVT